MELVAGTADRLDALATDTAGLGRVLRESEEGGTNTFAVADVKPFVLSDRRS
jgi:hypothetical protein